MNRFTSLDGLRGFCALAVALFHLPIASHFYTNPLVREAYVWVDFFFVLSGFVIAHAYRARLVSADAARSFLLRRIGRLWPLHLAVLAALVLLELGKLVFVGHMTSDMRPPFSGDTSLASLVSNLFLVHAWGFADASSWNIPSWSISAEFLAYLVFVVVRLVAPRRANAAAVGLFVVALVIVVLFSGNAASAERVISLRAIAGFFAGTLVYSAFERADRPRWSAGLATALELAVTVTALGYLVIVRQPNLSVLATPIFALAVYIFAAEAGLLSRALKSAPMQFLGLVSYSVYLTHGLVVAAFGGLARGLEHLAGTPLHQNAEALFGADVPDVELTALPNLWLGDLATLAFVATVIGLATITYRFVERPGQALFARIGKPAPVLQLKPAA